MSEKDHFSDYGEENQINSYQNQSSYADIADE